MTHIRLKKKTGGHISGSSRNQKHENNVPFPPQDEAPVANDLNQDLKTYLCARRLHHCADKLDKEFGMTTV